MANVKINLISSDSRKEPIDNTFKVHIDFNGTTWNEVFSTDTYTGVDTFTNYMESKDKEVERLHKEGEIPTDLYIDIKNQIDECYASYAETYRDRAVYQIWRVMDSRLLAKKW